MYLPIDISSLRRCRRVRGGRSALRMKKLQDLLWIKRSRRKKRDKRERDRRDLPLCSKHLMKQKSTSFSSSSPHFISSSSSSFLFSIHSWDLPPLKFSLSTACSPTVTPTTTTYNHLPWQPRRGREKEKCCLTTERQKSATDEKGEEIHIKRK